MIAAVGGAFGMIAAFAALVSLRCWGRRLVGGRPDGKEDKVEQGCRQPASEPTSCCLSRASTAEHGHAPGLAGAYCPADGAPQSRGGRPAGAFHGAGAAAFEVDHRQITPDEALLILEEMEQRLCVLARRIAAPTPRTRKLRFTARAKPDRYTSARQAAV